MTSLGKQITGSHPYHRLHRPYCKLLTVIVPLFSIPTHVYLSSSLSLGKFGHDQPAPWRQRFHHHPPPSLAKSLFRLRRCHVVSAITANPYSPVVHPVAKTFPPQVSQTLSQKHCRQFGLTGI